MGTVVTMTVLDDSADRAAETLALAYQRMHRGIDELNRYEDASALGVLNADGRLNDCPDNLLHLLRRARSLHLLSDGAFDVTVAPVIDVLQAHRADGLPGLPDDAALEAAARRINADAVRVHGREVMFEQDVDVTLDGIAKGHIVDTMAAVIARRGAQGYLINAGGDIRAQGTRDGSEPWQVGVRDPSSLDDELDVLAIGTGAVATSGDYEIYFDRDRTRHHIVNASGTSPAECTSATVRAPSAMLADALATAAFVAGPERGPALVESVPGCACLLVDAEGRQHPSSNWRSGRRRSGAQ